MVALRARLDPRQAVLDGVVDRLVVAGLEMQEGMAFQAPPVAAVERVVCLLYTSTLPTTSRVVMAGVGG